MARPHIPTRSAPAPFRYPANFHCTENGDYVKYGQRVFEGRVARGDDYWTEAAETYCLEDVTAHVWIAHQRYPTKGRVWHPGGAHPFVGLNEALAHNGDFANHHAVTEYLRQRNIAPLFLKDTEVSVLLFDLWDRSYGYPLEVTLEALAPTAERDLEMLSPEKQQLYRTIQATHMHGSPDGPWFFIIARSQPDERKWQLLGITDTSMLRPQVFALYESPEPDSGRDYKDTADAGDVQLGLIASERQALQATLRSLAAEDARFLPHADKYWSARGGSHTDGGAFVYTVTRGHGDGLSDQADGHSYRLSGTDKLGAAMSSAADQKHVNRRSLQPNRVTRGFRDPVLEAIYYAFDDGGAPTLFDWAVSDVHNWDFDQTAALVAMVTDFGDCGAAEWAFAREALTLLRDRHYDPGRKRRASLLTLLDAGLERLFSTIPLITDRGSRSPETPLARISWETRHLLNVPTQDRSTLLIDGRRFPPKGEHSAARLLQSAYQLGWERFIGYNWRGGHFVACGLGPDTGNVQIEVYGDAGDYLGSGLDGAQIHVHGDAQDQVGQILKSGTLVIHGDVGQTFLYGAKGGEIYVKGSAAGRPLINAVGRPRAVINGTCLDYLAESFMAGNPLDGGGFVILNGITFDPHGRLVEMETPYPGSNLFSLAEGGAIYLRDPHGSVAGDQLNGGRFAELTDADWSLIKPYLIKNKQLLGIDVDELLTVDGQRRPPGEVYRKIEVLNAGL